MIKYGIAAALATLLFATRPARAQETFGSAGQFALSAERLFGVVVTSTKTEETDTTNTTTYTLISLFSSPANNVLSNYSFARVAGDYFVGTGISIGAALAYISVSGTNETEFMGMSQENDTFSTSGFLLAPRVGYAAMFNPSVGIWPRAGVTYLRLSTENATETQESVGSRTAFTLEVPLVIVAAPHAAITVGPTLDLGIGGSNETTDDDPVTPDQEEDVTGTDYGLMAGLTIFL